MAYGRAPLPLYIHRKVFTGQWSLISLGIYLCLVDTVIEKVCSWGQKWVEFYAGIHVKCQYLCNLIEFIPVDAPRIYPNPFFMWIGCYWNIFQRFTHCSFARMGFHHLNEKINSLTQKYAYIWLHCKQLMVNRAHKIYVFGSTYHFPTAPLPAYDTAAAAAVPFISCQQLQCCAMLKNSCEYCVCTKNWTGLHVSHTLYFCQSASIQNDWLLQVCGACAAYTLSIVSGRCIHHPIYTHRTMARLKHLCHLSNRMNS